LETKNRYKNDILKYLKNNFSKISFIDFIRTLKLKQKISFKELFKKSKITPYLTLASQGSDVQNFKIDDETQNITIETNFLGLYGISTPLPTFYTEDLLDEKITDDEEVTKDFYDIFNQHKYEQFFDGWLKYRLGNRIVENDEKDVLNLFYNFIGGQISNVTFKHINSYELLRYSHILLHSTKSADGLEQLLRGLLDIDTIKIEQLVCTKHKIDEVQLNVLGVKNCQIGEDMYVGDSIYDHMWAINIVLYDLNEIEFHNFSYKYDKYDILQEIVSYYVGKNITWNPIYKLKEKAEPIVLGNKNWSSLGLTSWI
jgi:type VI secretion system protein ImpH